MPLNLIIFVLFPSPLLYILPRLEEPPRVQGSHCHLLPSSVEQNAYAESRLWMENPFHLYFHSVCEWNFFKYYFIPSHLRCLKFPDVLKLWNVGTITQIALTGPLTFLEHNAKRQWVSWGQQVDFLLQNKPRVTSYPKSGKVVSANSTKDVPSCSWWKWIRDIWETN